jgi:hypothetical protein
VSKKFFQWHSAKILIDYFSFRAENLVVLANSFQCINQDLIAFLPHLAYVKKFWFFATYHCNLSNLQAWRTIFSDFFSNVLPLLQKRVG